MFNRDRFPIIPYGSVWRTLPAAAKDVYLAILFHYTAAGDQPVPFTFTHAEFQLRLAPSTYNHAIKQLITRGFIERVYQGSFHNRRSLYIISDAYESWGLDGWEFRSIKTPQQKASFQSSMFKSWMKKSLNTERKSPVTTQNDSYRSGLRKITRNAFE